MKIMMTFMLIATFSFAAIAQQEEKSEKSKSQSEIPAAVKDAFQKDFPDVKDASWKAENSDFEAEFMLNGTECSANYDKTGHRMEVEITINSDQLPKAALDYINKNYQNCQIHEASKITNDKNVITYEAEIKINDKSKDLLFDDNGKYLSKEED
jgi:hypothetical protein